MIRLEKKIITYNDNNQLTTKQSESESTGKKEKVYEMHTFNEEIDTTFSQLLSLFVYIY